MSEDRDAKSEVHSTYLKLTWQNAAQVLVMLGVLAGMWFRVEMGLSEVRTEAAIQARRIDEMDARARVDHDSLTAIISKLSQPKP